MAIEKIRTRLFLTSKLTASSSLVIPYGTSAPTMTTSDAGELRVAHVGGTARLYFKSGGTTFFINVGASGTVSSGTAA